MKSKISIALCAAILTFSGCNETHVKKSELDTALVVAVQNEKKIVVQVPQIDHFKLQNKPYVNLQKKSQKL